MHKQSFMKKTFFAALILCATQVQASGIVPQPLQPLQENTSRVIVFRKFIPFGFRLGYKLRKGDKVLTDIRTNSFNVLCVESGPAEFSAKIAKRTTLSLDLKPGETYFIKSSIGAGIFGKPKLTYLTKEEVSQQAKKGFLRKRLEQYQIEL